MTQATAFSKGLRAWFLLCGVMVLAGCEAPSFDRMGKMFETDQSNEAAAEALARSDTDVSGPPDIRTELPSGQITFDDAMATSSARAAEKSSGASGPFQYECTNGVTIKAMYPDPDTAFLGIRDMAFELYRVPAGSGMRYATEDGLTPTSGLIWWAKGSDAMLIEMILDDSVHPSDYPSLATCRYR